MENDDIKMLIECSTSFEKADAALKEFTEFKDDEERISYLQEMFGCRIVGRSGENVHTDYVALLTAIVNEKWRR